MNIVMLERKNIGADVDVSEFEKLGNFYVYETTTKDEMLKRGLNADILIINKLPVNQDTIGTFAKLKLICITATGTDNVDISYCASRGIAVCNCKGYSTESVVQHTFAALFYVYEKLRYYDDYVKSGQYAQNTIFTHFDEVFYELERKTWGIVGLGDIGRGVARVAKAFGCRIIFYSTSGKNCNTEFQRVEWEELLAESDIISIHAPLNEATRNLFSQKSFSKMKKNAYLINMGRGPIVNEEDLVYALNNNQIAGAALDVVSKEPIDANNPLMEIKDSRKLLVTPHIAWATQEARSRLMKEVFLNINAYLAGEKRNRLD